MVEILSPKSFKITTGDESSSVTEVFSLPENISMWQSLNAMALVGKVSRKCSEPIAKILNVLFGESGNGTDGETTAQKIDRIQAQLKAAMNGEMLAAIPEGIADLTEILVQESIPQKLAAIFFLKKGEARIGRDILSTRAEQFDELPMKVLYEGLTDFFGKKTNANKSSQSSLETTAPGVSAN